VSISYKLFSKPIVEKMSNTIVSNLPESYVNMSYHETISGLEMNCKSISDNESKLKELKHNYDKTKSAIELKHNSTTQFKKTIIKNSKIENKIESLDNKIDIVIKGFHDTINDNEKRRIDRIQAVKDKYEAKMEKEINDINNTANSYKTYLLTEIQKQESKKQFTIKDLSANIIEPSIGDVIDEEAFPVLVKLKCDIKKLEDELKEYNIERKYLLIANTNAYEKQKQSNLREQQQQELELQYKQQQLLEKARQESKRQREEQNKRDQERWAKQAEERIENEKKEKEKEKQKAIIKEWNDKFYKPLSDDDKKKFSKLNYTPHKELLRAMDNLNDIKKYINDKYPIVEKRYCFEELIDNKKIVLSAEQRDYYYDLNLNEQDKIVALKTKTKQRDEIIRLYNESIKEKEDDDEEDDDEEENN